MKRTAAFAAILGVSMGAHAELGSCNLLAQTVASTAIWRDNGVPIEKAQSNVEAVLAQMPATMDDKKKWHDTVASIYGSHVPAEQLSGTLGNLCQ